MSAGSLQVVCAAVWRHAVELGGVIAVAVLLTHPSTGGAAVYVADPSSYVRLLALLRPGDELALKAGVYLRGLALRGIHGTPDQPITISGPARGGTALLMGRPGANTISLADASYVTLRDLRLDGRQLDADAVKAERGNHDVHHVTLERLTIVNHGAMQGVVGISTKCPAWGWVIRNNVIIGAGTGLYLGDSDGSAPFFAGVIEGNVIVDTIGYNLQIKHQVARPILGNAIRGPSATIIRNNVFAKTRNASTGDLARPNVLVGHFPLTGAGKDDHYVITGNVFYENATEALFQGEGNLDLENNVFLAGTGSAIVVQPHHDIPRRVLIADNFVAAAAQGILIAGADPGAIQEVARNRVYAADPIRGGVLRENVTGNYEEAEPALARIARGGAPFGGGSTEAMAKRACALPREESPEPQSVAPRDARRHPVCVFVRSLAKEATN